MMLSLNLEGFETAVLTEHIELYHDDIKAVNTETDEAVAPKKRALPENDREVLLQKHSWNMLRYTY
jgi:alpha-N-arabinofuranosidase